ncbi:MAG TPA: acyl-CoA dehydrogenase family protein [Tepidiformaceae bacterium]|nr:acyl-CoA dehydrogenase family protein [Tepidiformaceae bacterium]
MENELQARTEAGRELVTMAERFADEFSARAAQYDRLGEFPHDHLQALKLAGFLYAPAPVHCGGMGVESVHDLMVATSRLARGDASLTLGVNMHLLTFVSFARQWRMAKNRGDEARVGLLEATMSSLVREGAVIAAAISEPDQDLIRPQTEAILTDAGWVINGLKIFCSMAPAATHFSTAVRYTDDAGMERYAYAVIPRDTPGLTVNDDWDALGMRASGSVSVSFENAALPGRGPGKGVPAGVISAEHLEQILPSGPAHTSASLGVAEAGHRLAVEAVCRKRQRQPEKEVRGFVQERAAKNSIDLAAARAVFSRALSMIDEYYESHPTERGTLSEIGPVFAEVQRAKTFVNEAAVRILDRSLAMSGGAAYMNGNPLSRLYRDARAGAFMHPLGANVAMEYLGAATLGLRPVNF